MVQINKQATKNSRLSIYWHHTFYLDESLHGLHVLGSGLDVNHAAGTD